ncbi:MAG TPA: chorismate-binding protein, partial [Solirubrobacterales bacterium]
MSAPGDAWASSLSDSLRASLREAAQNGHRTLASVTVAVDEIDPCAAVFASRLASDRWFCWEQPDREFALATLGVAHESNSRGKARFGDVARECLRIAEEAIVEEPGDLPAGAGPVWTGGFAFDPDGAGSSPWSSFSAATMSLPEVSICRMGEETFLTVNLVVGPGDDLEQAADLAESRVSGLRTDPLSLIDPHRLERPTIRSARPPGDFEDAVEEATGRIDAGALEKVVLAREVLISSPAAHDPGAVFGALREHFPSCFCFCCGTPEAAFVGA